MSVARRIADLEQAVRSQPEAETYVTCEELAADDEGRSVLADLDRLMATGTSPSMVLLRERLPHGRQSATSYTEWLSGVADDPIGFELLGRLRNKMAAIVAARTGRGREAARQPR